MRVTYKFLLLFFFRKVIEVCVLHLKNNFRVLLSIISTLIKLILRPSIYMPMLTITIWLDTYILLLCIYFQDVKWLQTIIRMEVPELKGDCIKLAAESCANDYGGNWRGSVNCAVRIVKMISIFNIKLYNLICFIFNFVFRKHT